MRIRGFSKTYDGRTVLQMPELELEAGRVYAVVGTNGSGKSTLAKVLAGVETADDGLPVLPAQTVGYMPQKSFAFRMRVRDNIMLNGRDAAKAEELMAALHIEELADKPANKLSGGETARMSLARLMMKKYELLILDEPTASLDMESTALAEQLVKSRCGIDGCAVLFVTHSLQQARRIADYALFFNEGRLVEYGEKSSALYAPKEEQTRRFLNFYG